MAQFVITFFSILLCLASPATEPQPHCGPLLDVNSAISFPKGSAPHIDYKAYPQVPANWRTCPRNELPELKLRPRVDTDEVATLFGFPARRAPQDFYAAMERSYDIEDFVHVYYLARHPHFDLVSRRLAALGPKFRAMLFDPGLLSHAMEFEKFLGSVGMTWKCPWELRTAFSKHLGTRKVFRALALSPTLALGFPTNGIPSQALSKIDRAKALSVFQTESFGRQISNHIYQHTALFQSVTEYPDVAIAVAGEKWARMNSDLELRAKWKGVRVDDSQRPHVYLFELSVPALDLVSLGSYGFDMAKIVKVLSGSDDPSYTPRLVVRDKHTNQKNEYAHDERTESLVNFMIPPEWIRRTIEVESPDRYLLQ